MVGKSGDEPPTINASGERVERACAFPIVAIGASAGGLDAYRRLLQALPADTGMAFVLIQHLHPDFPSQLADILSRSTPMPIVEVSDEPQIQANHVYVIPPARSMVIDRDRLQLHPRSTDRRAHHPVDAFMRSLAEWHGNCGIGVVLSGTGNDGVEGMEEIKAEGGITFAQDASAQYDGMPNAAISAGCVDFVMTPEEIASELARIAAHPYVMSRAEAREQEDETAVRAILQLVLDATGVDFTHYKSTTLQRRLTRRMLLHGMDSPEQYLGLLRAEPREVHELYRDFLINVTRFFRDPESFEALTTQVFPKLFAGRAENQPIRVWALGCSTGEEAYSLAIGLHEYATSHDLGVPFQLFATDLSEKGIESARNGLYSGDIENQVSPERLKRYFEKTDGGYRIGKQIREACVFARQNVLSDPPFSHIDLISCRNLLIYLEPVLQQRVLPVFHYALNPGGYLWLGSAETIGSFDNLFDNVDTRHRIYRARGSQAVGALPLAALRPILPRPLPAPVRPAQLPPLHDPLRDADRVLLTRYAPAAVLINGEDEVAQFRGDTGPYVVMGGGRPNLNLFKMARQGLLLPLRESIDSARRSGMPVTGSASLVEGQASRTIEFDVLPVHGESAEQLHLLVVFRPAAVEAGTPALAPRSPTESREESEQYRAECTRLGLELQATRDYLHALIEQRDSTNEELQSTNEEAQSANEELQSINEELQTTKEEMESANEELISVNEELSKRHEQLTQANDDLTNIIASTEIALVKVGPDLRIRRFTPAAQALLSLIGSDVGRPLGDLKLSFAIDDIESCLLAAIRGRAVPDRDVRDRNGNWYSLRIRPYRASGGEIDGAVLVMVDIGQQKRTAASLRDSQRRFSLLMEGGTGIAIIMLDLQGHVLDWNAGAERLFQYSEAEVRGKPLSMLFETERRRRVAEELESALRDGVSVDEHAMRRRDGSTFWGSGVLTVLRDEEGRTCGFSKVVSDVSGRHRVEEERRVAEQRKDEFLSILAHELRNPLAPIRSSIHLLDSPALDDKGARQARSVIKRQVAQMVRLIDDLLDVARIGKGKIEFRPEPLELATVIETGVQSARDAIDSAGQKLEVELPKSPVLLYADHARLAQAISNLLVNAARYTPDRGQISVSATAEPNELRIAVADSGIGIDADQQQEIFELFAQAGNVPGRSRNGLGIGLTMVRLLVEMHGGRVQVHSDGPGTGSVFTLCLPRNAHQPAKSIGEGPGEVLPAGQRILLVDDHRDSADTLANSLRLLGHEVTVAYEGEGALALAEQCAPDIVVLDLALPGINGHEVGKRLRRTQAGQQSLMVALTGYGQETQVEASKAAGFDAHFVKPMDPLRLSVELESLRRARGK